MGIVELALLAVSLSMDAFAITIIAGMVSKGKLLRKSLTAGLYFGGFQMLMPIIGYYAAAMFADIIVNIDHWIVFAALSIIGARMIVNGIKKGGGDDKVLSIVKSSANDGPEIIEGFFKIKNMLPLAFATSIDALASGIYFAFQGEGIMKSASFVGITTFGISVIGFYIGKRFGNLFKTKAEIAGGIVLLLIGIRILLEHLNII